MINGSRVAIGLLGLVALVSLCPAQEFRLTEGQAISFAKLALKGIGKEYPNKPADVLNSNNDVKGPREIHPAFYGCYDWHSAVHWHWMLIRILKLYPKLPIEGEIRGALAENLSAKNLEIEALYFSRPLARSFERPYGWSWLLKLAEELQTWDDAQGKEWATNLQPLSEVIAKQYVDYFPKQTYPNRSGVHSSTAFGLTFALDYARMSRDAKLEQLVLERAKHYFANDENIPAAWEPDGADFFSPSLMEADLMRRVLPTAKFKAWLQKFLPELGDGKPENLLRPATVTDRTDPQLVHLDGLNISRAWCMRSIAGAYPKDDPVHKVLMESAKLHAEAALPHITSGDYAGEHWLASFATYLLTNEE
jgi:hypothetical protein